MGVDGPEGASTSLLERLPFAAHIEHAYTPRETALYGGADHVVLEEEVRIGRIRRRRGDALCKPSDRFWGLRRGGEDHKPSCRRCIEIAERAIPAVEWECFDIFFGFEEVRELRPGVLDGDAEHVFTNGHCHSFAEAIRRLCGPAEMVFAFDFPGEDRGPRGVQGHVLIRIGGRYLDARGWIDELVEVEDANRAFEREWDRVVVIGPLGWITMSSGWLGLRADDALPFAAALLDRLGVRMNSPDYGRGGKEVPGCTGL